MTRARVLLAGTLVLVAACAEPTPPSRAGTYAFDLSGEVFHWPPERLPVRIYAVARGNLPFLTERAAGAWSELFLYGEFASTMVGDSATADLIVAWTDSVPPDVPPDTSTVVSCSGVTNVPATDSASGRFTGPFHIFLTVLSGFTPAQVQACLRRTAIHELGHALGLFQHSPDPADIMHQPPLVPAPSDQDRRTVEVLYHTPATVLPAP